MVKDKQKEEITTKEEIKETTSNKENNDLLKEVEALRKFKEETMAEKTKIQAELKAAHERDKAKQKEALNVSDSFFGIKEGKIDADRKLPKQEKSKIEAIWDELAKEGIPKRYYD